MLNPILLPCLLLCAAVMLPVAADPAVPTPLPSAQIPSSADALDIMPLKKALAPLGSSTLTLHTIINMTGSRAGLAFTFKESAQIVSSRPGHFHAALTQFDTQGAPQKRLIVVSNGATVWTYQPGLAQYSMTTSRAFEAADDDLPALGLVASGFYLGEGHLLVEGFHSLTPENSAEVIAALRRTDVTLSRRTASQSGQDDYVYSMTLVKQGLTYQFYVDSQTSALSRVDLTGTQNGMQITFREDIKDIKGNIVVPKSTFVFVPPPGTLKNNQITVNPF